MATTAAFLVTGASGQVGHELARSLLPLGSVVALHRRDLDLQDEASIRAAVRRVRPAIILNAAAYTAVDKAESEPRLSAAINADAPRILAQEASDLGAVVIHYSTDYVFDGTGPGAYRETDPPNPQSAYGRTKLDGEEAIKAIGAPHIILRTSWLYGVRGRNFLRTMLRLAHAEHTIRVVGDQVGAPTWSRTVAETTATIIARLQAGRSLATAAASVSGVYHLKADGATSWHGFAESIVEGYALRSGIPTVTMINSADYPTTAKRPANSRLDCSKIESVFRVLRSSWQSQLSLVLDDYAELGSSELPVGRSRCATNKD